LTPAKRNVDLLKYDARRRHAGHPFGRPRHFRFQGSFEQTTSVTVSQEDRKTATEAIPETMTDRALSRSLSLSTSAAFTAPATRRGVRMPLPKSAQLLGAIIFVALVSLARFSGLEAKLDSCTILKPNAFKTKLPRLERYCGL
jgi:hypothetical protein